MDKKCLRLAALCSQAVDYAKNGVPVNLDENPLPPLLIRCKPDWHAAEVVSPRQTDYYESSRALGYMYRAITIEDPQDIPWAPVQREPLSDPISVRLKPLVHRQLLSSADPTGKSPEIVKLFRWYVDELTYICSTHTLSNTPGVRLLEEEVVVGTILAKCSQRRWRKDRMYRMRLHASTLVRNIREELLEATQGGRPHTRDELLLGLEKAWAAWDLGVRKDKEFGASSFGLLALGMIFDCLDGLGGLEEYREDGSGAFFSEPNNPCYTDIHS